MAGDVHERRGGDVRSGGKGTKVDAGGTMTDGKGTTVSTTEHAGPPAPRPETRGEFRVARGRETGNETRENKARGKQKDARARAMEGTGEQSPAGKRTKEKSKYDVTNGNNGETRNDVTCLHI